jgi:glycosyltransferase involved in cell wall biosynthesis
VFASDLIRSLNGAGVEQRVAVLRDSGEEGIRYDAPEHLLASNGWMAPAIRMLPSAVGPLRTVIRKWRPDIVQVHANSLKYAIPAVTGLGTPVVSRMVGPSPENIGGLRRAGHGWLMRRATRVVAVGESVRREVVDVFRVPPDRVISIPNAVDSRRVRSTKGRDVTRDSHGIPRSSSVILSLGALTWEKDPIGHVEIVARVLGQHRDVFHAIVGDGPLRSEVEAMVAGRRLNDTVRLFPARADVADFLAMSDVLLVASQTEGIPGSVIEAGMLEIPTAAYAVGGVPEVVVDKVTGRLARAGDVSGLAMCVLELLENPNASRAMGEAARERYLSLFDIATIAPRYFELYQELADS